MASNNNLLTAHIVVQFAEADANVSVVAEIDDRENGYNLGKTTFYFGDTPHILLFIPDGYYVDQVLTSAGAVAFVADDSKTIETYLAYPNEDSASLSYPVDSALSYTWLGQNHGVISTPDQFTAKLPTRAIDPSTKKPIPEYRIGVASASYVSECKVYKLYNVPAGIAQVMVYFVVKKIV